MKILLLLTEFILSCIHNIFILFQSIFLPLMAIGVHSLLNIRVQLRVFLKVIFSSPPTILSNQDITPNTTHVRIIKTEDKLQQVAGSTLVGPKKQVAALAQGPVRKSEESGPFAKGETFPRSWRRTGATKPKRVSDRQRKRRGPSEWSKTRQEF